MLTTLKTIISSFFTKYGSFAYSAILSIVLFGLGVYASSLYYRAQIASMREQTASALANAEAEAKNKLLEAINARDDSLRELDSVRANVRDLALRVRRAEDSASASRSTQGDDRAALSRCRRLLREGADLLTEGCERYGGCAADADALAVLVK